MANKDVIQDSELIQYVTENGGPFLPICFCLDTSQSMRLKVSRSDETDGPSRIQSLQDGLNRFYQIISDNEDTQDTVHAAVVTFDASVRTLEDFRLMDGRPAPTLRLGAEDGTAMGPGVCRALDMIERYNDFLTQSGARRFTPWLILMSDGMPTVGRGEASLAKQRIQTLVRARKLRVFPFGIGTEAVLRELNRYSPEQAAFYLDSHQMEGLFSWLIHTIVSVSSGEIDGYSKIGLEKYQLTSWAEKL